MRITGAAVAIAAALSAAACNQVFGLADTLAVDAAGDGPPIDASIDDDQDGVPNADDVCPSVADPAQHDEDGDQIGDACDSCPLDPSTAADDAELDGIPDACDPRPASPDCLVLFDSFSSYLAQDWERVAGSQVAQLPDALRLTTPNPRTGIHPTGMVGPHSMRARFRDPTLGTTDQLRLLGSSQVNNSDIGHGCWLTQTKLYLVDVIVGPPPELAVSPAIATGDSLLITLAHDASEFGCTVARGTETYAQSKPVGQAPGGDATMIVIVGGDITLTAVAFYAAKSGLCPVPVIR